MSSTASASGLLIGEPDAAARTRLCSLERELIRRPSHRDPRHWTADGQQLNGASHRCHVDDV
jgi:hypothetical protein